MTVIIWIFRQEYVIDATFFWKREELTRALFYHKLILMTLIALRSFVTQNLRVLVEYVLLPRVIFNLLSPKRKKPVVQR